MSASTDPDHFFQTTSSLESSAQRTAKSKNKNGDPIAFPSKILALTQDPNYSNAVYIAESGGTIKRLNLDARKVTKAYRGPTAPLTSICFSTNGKILFAGCWDKSVWSWDVSSTNSTRRFVGHTDFVKTVVTVPARLSPTKFELLVSGSADSEIIFWDVKSGERLHVLKGHTRGIQDLVIDPVVAPTPNSDVEVPVLWSASSSREIRPCSLQVNTVKEGSARLNNVSLEAPILQHDTSVYRLRFDEDGDIWTSSADKTAKHLLRSQGWTSDTTLTHPDFVNDIVIHETGGWIITACRDEEVRVWNRATGVVLHIFSGHFDAVTGLCLLENTNTLVSISIDATVRTWSLKPADLQQAVEDAKKPVGDGEGADEVKPNVELTEEEEQELAELMGEDD